MRQSKHPRAASRDQAESEWKFSASHAAETAIHCAAHIEPHFDRAAWKSADRVLAQFGERYLSCALPKELGETLHSKLSARLMANYGGIRG